MKSLILASLALAAVLPSFGQYSARTLTSKIVPQPQQPAPARPSPQYSPGIAPQAPQRPLTPAEAAKARIQKDKNDQKQLDFYKRRAEEGSDHAQYELGLRYLAGRGTPPNEKLGREWLAKAAKQGHTQATKKLAELGPEIHKAALVSAAPAATTTPAPAEKK